MVPKALVIGEVHLPPSIVVTKPVALARKVEPLRMAKLVTDESEVGFSAQSQCDQTDHLVQGQASVDDEGAGGEGGHVEVHLCVHQPKGERLVPDQSLVVALCVGDALLVIPVRACVRACMCACMCVHACMCVCA